MAAISIKDLVNQRMQQDTKKSREPAAAEEIVMIDINNLIPSKDNFYKVDDLEDLKLQIRLFGVLQPLLVVPEGKRYEIKAGHRRHSACMSLVEEEQMETLRFVPCIIKSKIEFGEEEECISLPENIKEDNEDEKWNSVDAIISKLTMIAANSFREKSEWEKMEEALQKESLIEELRKIVNIKGRTREILKEFTGGKIKEAQMGRYKVIKKNLCYELMEEFKAGNIGVTIAYEAAALSADYQQQACEIYRENGFLTGQDIKQLKRLEEAEILIEEDETERAEGQQAPEEKPSIEQHMNPPVEQETEEEYHTPHPESITSLCYSCQRYSDCNVKGGTCTNCDQYINKAEAEKTAEQRYSEEQAHIDRETGKELRKQQEEEAMSNLPGNQDQKEHQIRVAASIWENIVNEVQTFLLVKNEGYKTGDKLIMQQYRNGEPTEEEIEADIIFVLKDYTGLKEEYCIIGFKNKWYSLNS